MTGHYTHQINYVFVQYYFDMAAVLSELEVLNVGNNHEVLHFSRFVTNFEFWPICATCMDSSFIQVQHKLIYCATDENRLVV